MTCQALVLVIVRLINYPCCANRMTIAPDSPWEMFP
jgi:hypothetical protein